MWCKLFWNESHDKNGFANALVKTLTFAIRQRVLDDEIVVVIKKKE